MFLIRPLPANIWAAKLTGTRQWHWKLHEGLWRLFSRRRRLSPWHGPHEKPQPRQPWHVEVARAIGHLFCKQRWWKKPDIKTFSFPTSFWYILLLECEMCNIKKWQVWSVISTTRTLTANLDVENLDFVGRECGILYPLWTSDKDSHFSKSSSRIRYLTRHWLALRYVATSSFKLCYCIAVHCNELLTICYSAPLLNWVMDESISCMLLSDFDSFIHKNKTTVYC